MSKVLTERRRQSANSEVGQESKCADSRERYMFLPARPAERIIGVVRVGMRDEHYCAVGRVACYTYINQD